MIRRIVIIVAVLFAMYTCSGCTTLTPEQRAERDAFNADVWLVCVANYTHELTPMIHNNHTHSRTRAPQGAASQRINRRDDIRDNNCRAIYRAAIEEY